MRNANNAPEMLCHTAATSPPITGNGTLWTSDQAMAVPFEGMEGKEWRIGGEPKFSLRWGEELKKKLLDKAR